MKTKLIAVIFASFGMAAPAWALDASMSLSPSLPMAPPGAIVTVEVLVSSPEQIGALLCTVEYNSSAAQFISAQLGSATSSGFSIPNLYENIPGGNSTAGTDSNVFLQIVGSGVSFFTGDDQQVAVLTFQMAAANCRQTPLSFSTDCQETHLSTLQLQTICNPVIVAGEMETECTSAAPLHPRLFELSQNTPNPFNPSTSIAFELSTEGAVQLQVFDVTGRVVRHLEDRILNAGSHQVVWDGRNDAGATLPAGVYFYRLTMNGESSTRRSMLVK